ncbi:hypothetical protein BZA70DRAFT_287638 [Myxozyma melibiosi]|uniref:C2H2-type domain-containing protein n=1 Tax=Myxozyma melibiosi TaxID=54550 RepID=A0ABR1FEP9_9ASCO
MVRKKSASANLQKLLERPWCYYCERDFDDLKVLISHQRALHFKCEHCNKRLNTAGGLVIHVQQMHKETITQVYNSIEGCPRGRRHRNLRTGRNPPEAIKEHEKRLREKFKIPDTVSAVSKPAYLSAAAASARESLSPPPKAAGAAKFKITKVDREDIQARLKAFVAKKKAEREAAATEGVEVKTEEVEVKTEVAT